MLLLLFTRILLDDDDDDDDDVAVVVVVSVVAFIVPLMKEFFNIPILFFCVFRYSFRVCFLENSGFRVCSKPYTLKLIEALRNKLHWTNRMSRHKPKLAPSRRIYRESIYKKREMGLKHICVAATTVALASSSSTAAATNLDGAAFLETFDDGLKGWVKSEVEQYTGAFVRSFV